MKKFLIIAVIITTLASSCKKYEDGPRFSLRTKKARLAGTWLNVKETDIGGGNPSYNDEEQDKEWWTFDKDGSGKFVDYTYDNISPSGSPIWYQASTPFNWEFEDKKEKIKISIYGVSYEAEILRLTNKEFWFRTDDTEYYLEKE